METNFSHIFFVSFVGVFKSFHSEWKLTRNSCGAIEGFSVTTDWIAGDELDWTIASWKRVNQDDQSDIDSSTSRDRTSYIHTNTEQEMEINLNTRKGFHIHITAFF